MIFLMLLGVCSPLMYGGVRMGIAAYHVSVASEKLVSDIRGQAFSAAREDIKSLSVALDGIEAGASGLGFWRRMPYLVSLVRSLQDAMNALRFAMSSVETLLGIGQSMQEAYVALAQSSSLDLDVALHRRFQDLSIDEKRRLLAEFSASIPSLRKAHDMAVLALDEWQNIDRASLPLSVQKQVDIFAARLQSLTIRTRQVTEMADIALSLLGYPYEKRYLVFLQNSDELRPTGGFWGVAGLLRVNAGDIQEIAFHDVYAFDALAGGLTDAPPEPLRRELGVNKWFLRDSNWSPDFPQSAERAMDLVARTGVPGNGKDTHVDGVMAFSPEVFRRLLLITGPLMVDGKTFDAQNFFDVLQYDVEEGFLHRGGSVQDRKDVVMRVGQALFTSLASLPASRWGEVMDALMTSLLQKDVLVYTRDRSLQPLIDARGWSGRTRSTNGDFLWVVDANLAALKTDGKMIKHLRRTLFQDSQSGRWLADLTLTYENTVKAIDWRYTRYRDYVRVYVPEGSELISTVGAMKNDKTKTGGVAVPGTVDVMHDLGKTVFGAFWAIEPGETRTLTFRYALPAYAAPTQDGYELLIQKQPGNDVELTADFSFGKKIRTASPSEDPADFGDARYRLRVPLTLDRRLEIGF